MLGMYLTFCILCPWILKIESPLRHTQSLCVNRCVVRLHFFGRRPALLSALFFSLLERGRQYLLIKNKT